LLLGLLWVLLWSLPISTLIAGGWLETRYKALPVQQYPQADAIVVLGGHIQGNRRNWFEPYERDNVIGRESMALNLFNAQRAPLIVLSSGAQSGTVSDTASMARALMLRGISPSAIVQETQSQSTRDNAIQTQQILTQSGARRILLVTSALHMPRAMAAFERTNLRAIAAPLPEQIRILSHERTNPWVPNLHALMASRTILKEYAGLFLHGIDVVIHSLTDQLNLR
jgi:uncharacterized SAM-binding protein YcdF (DUF218 family)